MIKISNLRNKKIIFNFVVSLIQQDLLHLSVSDHHTHQPYNFHLRPLKILPRPHCTQQQNLKTIQLSFFFGESFDFCVSNLTWLAASLAYFQRNQTPPLAYCEEEIYSSQEDSSRMIIFLLKKTFIFLLIFLAILSPLSFNEDQELLKFILALLEGCFCGFFISFDGSCWFLDGEDEIENSF